MEKLLVAILGFVVGFYRAFVFSYSWGWFIVPIFHAPVLSVAGAWGISLLLSLLESSRIDENEILDFLLYVTMLTTVTWGIAFVVSSFL